LHEVAQPEPSERMKIDFHSLTEHLERVYTPRVAFRTVTLTDAWPLYESTRDPMFNMGLMWDQPASDSAVLERMDAIVSAARRGAMTAVSTVVRETGEWISLFRFQPYAAEPGLVETGIWTHRKFWRGQYSLELARACIDVAFTMTEVPLLIAAANPANTRVCMLLGICGFQPRRSALRRKESGVDVELTEYEITRADWSAAFTEPHFSQVVIGAPAKSAPVPA
jgi:RimJ/RimL family protein N-acetyltransferase